MQKTVPLTIFQPDGNKKQIGTVDIREDADGNLWGTAKILENEIAHAISDWVIGEMSIWTGASFIVPDIQEIRIREQARLYGLQVRHLEDNDLHDDRLRIQRSWLVFRQQFMNTPYYETAREAYQAAYAQIEE